MNLRNSTFILSSVMTSEGDASAEAVPVHLDQDTIQTIIAGVATKLQEEAARSSAGARSGAEDQSTSKGAGKKIPLH